MEEENLLVRHYPYFLLRIESWRLMEGEDFLQPATHLEERLRSARIWERAFSKNGQERQWFLWNNATAQPLLNEAHLRKLDQNK